MNCKGLKILMMLVIALVATTVAGALPVTIDTVKLNGDDLHAGHDNILVVDRNDEYQVRVIVTATEDVDNVQIEAAMRGYDHRDLAQDITDVFDMKANRTYVRNLNINVPDRMEKDVYALRLRIDDRAGDTTTETYYFDISNQRHDIVIEDVLFSPFGQVQDGRALLTSVRLRNNGMVNQEGVRVEVRIPELGIAAADYINEIEEGESLSSEELYMRIPQCTEEGTYDVEVKVEYHRGDKTTIQRETIDVVKSEVCDVDDEKVDDKPKTTLTIGPKEQSVEMGKSVTYPLTIKNAGTSSKTYVVNVDGYQDWAEVRVTPAKIVTLQPGETKALYVFLSPLADAREGKNMFSMSVESEGKTLKEFSLTADVKAAEEPTDAIDIKNVLLVGLLVLVVLLVILGLIIGFGKLRDNDKDFDEDNESGETYY